MVLLKWSDGDTITERSANNKGIRKGTEAEIAAIATVDNELGDITHNSTVGFLQVQTGGGATDKRGNLNVLLGADSTIVTGTTTSPVQVKDLDYIKCAEGFKGNTLTIVAMLKTSANTAHLRVRIDGSGSDSLDLSTASTSYVKVTGTIDITGVSDNAAHTIEFYLENTTSGTATMEQLEVYGI
jgi:hypothetical protein